MQATLDHLLGVIHMLNNAANGGPVPESLTSGLVGADPSGALAAELKTSLEAWRAPGALEAEVATPLGQLQGQLAVMLGCMEATAHTFDMAKAIGRPTAVDPDIAAVLLPFVEQLPLAYIRAAGEFGPEVTVQTNASDGDRLLGLLGRRP